MKARKAIVPDQGWSWLVLFAAFCCNITFDGIIYSFGVFYLDLLDHFGEGRARTSWIGSVISGTYSVVGPLASILANRFGCRVVTMSGALLASTGFILCTFSPNMWMMIVTYGIMAGVGFGLMYLCVYVMIGHFFHKYRALAMGIASCGSGVGTFIFAQISVLLIDHYSWKGAMWIVAGVVLNGVVMGAIFRPLPEEVHEDGTQKRPLVDLGLFRNPVFIVMCASSFICMIGFFVPFIYLPDFARGCGLSREQGAILLSIIGITNTIGRILCGFVTDKPWADALKIYNGSLILGGIATIACSWLQNFPLLCVYAAVFGVCVAAYVSLTAIILVEFLGLERLSNSFGFLNMFRGLATFIGAPLAGFLFDVQGDYDLAFYTAGSAILLAGLICLPLRYLTKCSQCCMKEDSSENISSDDKPIQPNHLKDHRLQQKYSSTFSLSGSYISIVLPNLYISNTPVSRSTHNLDSKNSIHRLHDKKRTYSLLKEHNGVDANNHYKSDSCLSNKKYNEILAS